MRVRVVVGGRLKIFFVHIIQHFISIIRGGGCILDSPCPSVCLSVPPSVGDMVSGA